MLTCLLIACALGVACALGIAAWRAGSARREVRSRLNRMAAVDPNAPFLEMFGDADPGTPVSVNGKGAWIEGFHAFQALGRDAVGPLADALAHERAEVRHAALAGLMSIAPVASGALPMLERAIAHEDSRTREHALRTLLRIGYPRERLSTILERALEDSEGRVWRAAARGLLKLDPGSKAACARIDRTLLPALAATLAQLHRVGLLEEHDANSLRAAAAEQLDLIHLIEVLERNAAAVRTEFVLLLDPNACANPAGPDVLASWVSPRVRSLGARTFWEPTTHEVRIARDGEILAEGVARDVTAVGALWNVALGPLGHEMLTLDLGTDDYYFVTVTHEAATTIRAEGLLQLGKGGS